MAVNLLMPFRFFLLGKTEIVINKSLISTCYNLLMGMIGFDGRGWSRIASREVPIS